MWLSIVTLLIILHPLQTVARSRRDMSWADQKKVQADREELYKQHRPLKYHFYLPLEVDDQDVTIPSPWSDTPDFRLPEPPWEVQEAPERPLMPWWGRTLPKLKYAEFNRPYLITPFLYRVSGARPRPLLLPLTYYKGWKYFRTSEKPEQLFCFCCTVYKRYTPLSTCAILTIKHVLTTATATELVLRRHPRKNTLENLLGAWYHLTDDCTGWKSERVTNCANGTTYMTPSRIHFHPYWVPPDRTNRSHPLPSTFDLALWSATFPLKNTKYLVVCNRGMSTANKFETPTPVTMDLLYIVGYQFVWDIRRMPMPWFMYAVKIRVSDDSFIKPCPKVEWGWFFCVQSRSWAQLGLDSGAGMYYDHEGWGEGGLTNMFRGVWHWRSAGLVALNTFSMKLRSRSMVHYFQPIDIYKVLDFLYAAYNGRQPYRWLDSRFNDTQWGTPKPKPWARIVWGYVWNWNVNEPAPRNPPWW